MTADTLTLIRHTGDPEGDGEYFKLLIEENALDSFAECGARSEFLGDPDRNDPHSGCVGDDQRGPGQA